MRGVSKVYGATLDLEHILKIGMLYTQVRYSRLAISSKRAFSVFLTMRAERSACEIKSG